MKTENDLTYFENELEELQIKYHNSKLCGFYVDENYYLEQKAKIEAKIKQLEH